MVHRVCNVVSRPFNTTLRHIVDVKAIGKLVVMVVVRVDAITGTPGGQE